MLDQLKELVSKIGADDTINEIRNVSPARMQIFLSNAILHASCCYQIPGFNLCKHAVRAYSKAYELYPADPSWAIIENAILQSAFTNAFVTTLRTLETNGDLKSQTNNSPDKGSDPFIAPEPSLNF